ncbi:MAG: metal ABC transporter substrate-binding protein, partial [Delftia sp.]|nr:metal ABC transporter substrate-binding protein [Delftia sp.]
MMTTTSPTLWPRLAAFLGAALLAGSALAAPLKIGVVPGIFADSVEAAAK